MERARATALRHKPHYPVLPCSFTLAPKLWPGFHASRGQLTFDISPAGRRVGGENRRSDNIGSPFHLRTQPVDATATG